MASEISLGPKDVEGAENAAGSSLPTLCGNKASCAPWSMVRAARQAVHTGTATHGVDTSTKEMSFKRFPPPIFSLLWYYFH